MDLETAGKLIGFGVAVWPTIRYVVRPTHRFIRRVSDGLNHVENMATWLGPNGGKSLGDQIRRGVSLAETTSVRMDYLCDRDDAAIFECRPDGANVRINETFTTQFGYSPDDMLGQRWVRMVHPHDRDRVMTEWQHAIDDQRLFESSYRVYTRAGVELRVRAIAEPRFVPGTAQLHRWMGRIVIERAEA